MKKLDGSAQAWAPSAYLVEEAPKPTAPPAPPAPTVRAVPPPPAAATTNGVNGTRPAAVKAKPTPPAPPKRPGGGRKPLPPPAPRDSAVSMGTSSGGSGRDTPNSSFDGKGDSRTPSLAGGLAEALRARQMSMQGKRDEEEDW